MVHADSTLAGFDLLERVAPGLVLIDFALPESGALAVRRMTAKRHPTCPTVLIAPTTLKPQWVFVFECDARVEKPVTAVRLQGALDLVGWDPQPRTPRRPPPVSTEPEPHLDIRFEEQPTTPRTVFDRVASRPRIQPHRVVPEKGRGDSGSGSSDPGDSGLGDSFLTESRLGDSLLIDSSLGETFLGESDLGESSLGDSGLGDSFPGDSGPPAKRGTQAPPHPPVRERRFATPRESGATHARMQPAERDTEEAQFSRVLQAYESRASSRDDHYLLDLAPSASLKQTRVRLRRIRRELKADALSQLPPNQRARTKQLLVRVKAAYDRIVATLVHDQWGRDQTTNKAFKREKTGQQRLESLRRLSRKPRSAPPERGQLRSDSGPMPVTPEGWARHFFELARREVSSKRWTTGLEHIRDALEKTPHDPHMMALEAWILAHIRSDDVTHKLENCANRLALALTLNDANPEAHYYLGRVRERQHLYVEAVDAYRSALRFESALNKKAILSRIRDIEANHIGRP